MASAAYGATHMQCQFLGEFAEMAGCGDLGSRSETAMTADSQPKTFHRAGVGYSRGRSRRLGFWCRGLKEWLRSFRRV